MVSQWFAATDSGAPFSFASFIPVIVAIVLAISSGVGSRIVEKVVKRSVRDTIAKWDRKAPGPAHESDEERDEREDNEAALAGYLGPRGVAMVAADAAERSTFVVTLLGVAFTYLAFLSHPTAGPLVGFCVGGMVVVVAGVAVWLYQKPLGTLGSQHRPILGAQVSDAWVLRLLLIVSNLVVGVLIAIFGV